MRGEEITDTSRLLGTALDEVAVLTRDVHRAVAGRLFGALGSAARPVHLAHNGIAAIAYTATRAGVRLLPPAIGAGAAAVHDPAARSAHDTARGHFALCVLNGFWGDRLDAQRPAIAPLMRVRTHEGQLRADPANVAGDAGSAATGRLVVFIHGLCENDRYWHIGAMKNWGSPDVTLGSLLRDEDGWTPLYVVVNSGLHISQNGHQLAQWLERLVGQWPVPVTEVALVGHSMGGLIARSAAHHGAELEHSWARQLRHVVGLGAPYTGAPLERVVARGTRAMSRLPETRPLATWLDRRSVGIKDLRHGAIVEADWFGVDYDLCLDDRCTDIGLVEGVAYSCVSATLSRNPTGWLAHDLLVQHASANGIGRARRIPFDGERSLHLGGKNHFHLLGHPQVYAALRTWLRTPLPSCA